MLRSLLKERRPGKRLEISYRVDANFSYTFKGLLVFSGQFEFSVDLY
jgi:hypothetical protein